MKDQGKSYKFHCRCLRTKNSLILDMKKPTKNVNKEIKQFDIANYIALQRQPSDFEKYTFMCNIWKPNTYFVFPKTLCGAKKFSCNQK